MHGAKEFNLFYEVQMRFIREFVGGSLPNIPWYMIWLQFFFSFSAKHPTLWWTWLVPFYILCPHPLNLWLRKPRPFRCAHIGFFTKFCDIRCCIADEWISDVKVPLVRSKLLCSIVLFAYKSKFSSPNRWHMPCWLKCQAFFFKKQNHQFIDSLKVD